MLRAARNQLARLTFDDTLPCGWENAQQVHYCGLKKNTAQLFTLQALSNLWMVRGKCLRLKSRYLKNIDSPLDAAVGHSDPF